MHIYILTYKREKVTTLKYIPAEWLDRTSLVVQESDKTLEGAYPEVQRLVLPAEVKDVAATRQYILENAADEKILQLDDDLTIGVLKQQGAYHLRDAGYDDMREILKRMEFLLDIYPHVGATARNEAHLSFAHRIREVGRAIRFHGMNAPWMTLALGININRVPTIEDYDFLLQILRQGVPNAIDCQVFVGDGGSNAEGGCSELRAVTKDGHYARMLQELHPEFVDLVEKETKTKEGVWKRTDVRVQWKKAFESAFEKGLLL